MIDRADLSAQPSAEVLGRGIRTYKPRRTRPTRRAERALRDHAEALLPTDGGPLDLAALFGAGTPVVMDIGFGDGSATATLAAADPATGVLAVDVHTPGVGELLWRLGSAGLDNVRVMEADAIAVLDRQVLPHALAGVRSYFPDPWPKARHHKRRLVQPAILDLVRSRLGPGGAWHLATDWAEYAAAIEETFAADPHWTGGAIPRPDGRPVTRYERRAEREGRPSVDLLYRVTEPV